MVVTNADEVYIIFMNHYGINFASSQNKERHEFVYTELKVS